MKNTGIKTGRALALVLAAVLASAGAMAEKPDWAGGGKNGKSKQKDMQEQRGESSQGKRDKKDRHFGDDQRTVIHNYYSEQYRMGRRCPPGLAKKNNGCMPPGQARKWAVGQPLPRDVVYYNLPSSIIVQLGVPPSGHRYVRVASDILLIAIGTGMVIDGIENLGRR